jgi:hypothetical protein
MLKPFDIEKAKAGAKVVTRLNHDVEIIKWDLDHPMEPKIVGVVTNKHGKESVHVFNYDGKFIETHESDIDLFLSCNIKEYYMNVYTDGSDFMYGELFKSKEDAENNIDLLESLVRTISVSWEE